jgi:acyl-CoA thioester hydrolase
MSGVNIYRTQVAPEWIDYNGHLRDAYYSLIVSLATDALMDRLGLDEAYRARTRCTLYTLEMHMHFLREVKKTDVVDVAVRILGTDRKRIHAAFDMRCGRYPDPVATAEIMLLHVHQGDEPKAQAFPPEVIEALARIAEEDAASAVATGAGAAAGRAGAAAGTGAVATGPTAAAMAGAPAREPPAPAPTIPGSRRMELRSRS